MEGLHFLKGGHESGQRAPGSDMGGRHLAPGPVFFNIFIQAAPIIIHEKSYVEFLLLSHEVLGREMGHCAPDRCGYCTACADCEGSCSECCAEPGGVGPGIHSPIRPFACK